MWFENYVIETIVMTRRDKTAEMHVTRTRVKE